MLRPNTAKGVAGVAVLISSAREAGAMAGTSACGVTATPAAEPEGAGAGVVRARGSSKMRFHLLRISRGLSKRFW